MVVWICLQMWTMDTQWNAGVGGSKDTSPGEVVLAASALMGKDVDDELTSMRSFMRMDF